MPAVSVRAQDVANESPAHISVVDGAALLERDGRSESAPASMPLLSGDRVRTQNGRVEILFNEGSTLHLDTNSVVDFQSDEVIRLLDGRVRLNIVGGANRRVAYRVDAPFAWIEVVRTGEYRISVYGGASAINDGREAEVELAVLRGAADLVNEDGRRSLGAGERAFARAGAAPSVQYVFNSASWDAFDRWSEARRDSRLGVSAEYLPEEVQAYATTFNQYGSWQNEPTYGYVWYPRARAGWRPYYYGSWTTLRPVGVDVDWIGSVGVADSPLWAMGFLRRRMVLDPWPHLGPGLGIVGVRARLRQLVSTRMEQPCRVRVQCRWVRRPSLQPLEWLDRRAASRIRPRLRERERDQLDAH